MGLKCRIHRKSNGEVDFVEAPNGEKSTLFKKALEYVKNTTDALNIWTTPYTIGFKNVNGNWESNKTNQASIKLPNRKGFNQGIDYISNLSKEYKKVNKIKGLAHQPVLSLNKQLSTEMAKAYEAVQGNDTSEKTMESYDAMIKETLNQYDFIVNKGLKVIKHEGIGEPYSNSKEMLIDLKENNTLKFLPNDVAFGQDIDLTKVENVGLKNSGRKLDTGYELTNSEVFRIVHDYFGHGILGNQFGAIGEENATLQHLTMFSNKAAPAVIFQTRGQNSWVNFSGVNKKASELRKEAKALREVGNFKKAKEKLKEADSLFKFAEPKINVFPPKYNFKKYDTARRIEEDEKIKKFNSSTTAQDNELSELLSQAVRGSSTERGIYRKESKGVRKQLGEFNVEIKAEYNLTENSQKEIQKAFPKFIGLQTIYEITEGEVYREMMQKAMAKQKFKASVTLHSAEEFSKMRMFVTEDGSTGITLDSTGFLGGAFSDPTAKRPNNLAPLMILGIKEGATIAEAFDTVLPDYYAKFGFKAVSTVAFNDVYKPSLENGALADWDYDTYKDYNNGRPDIVHLIYDGGERGNIESRLSQFEEYNSYEKELVTKYDNESYDASYNYMTRKYLEKYNLYKDHLNEPTKVSSQGMELDNNGEPLLKDVLNYIKNVKNSGIKLSPTDVAGIANNLYSLPINSIEELFQTLRSTFYSNGTFRINKVDLDNSLLYSETEVLDILSNPTLQNNIKDLVEKIETHYITQDSSVDKLINTHFFEDSNLVMDTTTTTGIGKYKALNPFVINKVLSSTLAGVKSRVDFDNLVMELPFESIITKYNTDLSFADSLYEKYSNLTVVPVMEYKEGNLENKSTKDTFATLKHVLITDLDNASLSVDVSLLTKLDNELWEGNIEDVSKVLKDIETKAIKYNIDMIGLSDTAQYKSREEVVGFLNEVEDFTTKLTQDIVTEGELKEFSGLIDNYLGRQIIPELKYIQLSEQNEGKTVLDVYPIKSELKMFTEDSLIKTKEGLYHKVNVNESFEEILQITYDLVLNNYKILPKEAYYPTGYDTDSTINLGKLNNVKNKDGIIRDINRFITKEISKYQGDITSKALLDLKKFYIYKHLFEHPLVSKTGFNSENELIKAQAFTGNFTYLTTDFLSDFNNYKLTNKLNNTVLYNEVLQFFEIGDRGIYLTQDDLHTKNTINVLSPSNEVMNNLKQYILISKESSLQGIYTLSNKVNPIVTKKETRNMIINNPNSLPIYKGNYELEGDLLITPNETREFIRTSKNIYEKVVKYGNASFYKQLPKSVDLNYKDYGINVNISNDIDVNKYKHYIKTKKTDFVSIKKLYTKNELNRINEEIDGCK